MDGEPQGYSRRKALLYAIGAAAAGGAAIVKGPRLINQLLSQNPNSDAQNKEPREKQSSQLEAQSVQAALKEIAGKTVEKTGYKYLLYPVSKQQALPDEFSPPSLVEVTRDAQLNHKGNVSVAESIQEPLAQLIDAAKGDGHTPYLRSGFRDAETQRAIFDRNVKSYMGANNVNRQTAEQAIEGSVSRPMHSEHNLGTAVDVMDAKMTHHDEGDLSGFEEPRNKFNEGFFGWLRDNAHRFGFVLSYPTGKDANTAKEGSGYGDAEPWHIRFVGEELATYMHDTLDYLNPESPHTLDTVLRTIQAQA